jgi:hypothetical protein
LTVAPRVIARSEATKQSILSLPRDGLHRYAPLHKRFAFVAGNDDPQARSVGYPAFGVSRNGAAG